MENDLSRSRSPLARRNRGTAGSEGARGRRGRARVNHARGRDANQPLLSVSFVFVSNFSASKIVSKTYPQ